MTKCWNCWLTHRHTHTLHSLSLFPYGNIAEQMDPNHTVAVAVYILRLGWTQRQTNTSFGNQLLTVFSPTLGSYYFIFHHLKLHYSFMMTEMNFFCCLFTWLPHPLSSPLTSSCQPPPPPKYLSVVDVRSGGAEWAAEKKNC